MIVAIERPAGSGKTTVGRLVAAALRFALVDTGLFYRAVTVEARHRSIAADDVAALTSMLGQVHIEINTSPSSDRVGPLVAVDGRDVSLEAQDPMIAADLSGISQIPELSRALVERH